MNDRIKYQSEILNDMVKLLQLLCQCKQSKLGLTLKNLPGKHEKNIQTDSSLDTSCNKVQNKNVPSKISHHPIDFIVGSDNENKKNNQNVKNKSPNEVNSVDKEVISSNISFNGQLTAIQKLRHQEFLNWNK